MSSKGKSKKRNSKEDDGPQSKKRTQENVSISIEHSVIKGYHDYRIAPPLQLNLNLQPEYCNINDKDAVLVWMPSMEDEGLDQSLLTKTNSQGILIQDLVSPVPLIIGHVPKMLATVFRQYIDKGCKVTCKATSHPQPSFHPWPHQLEKGGGVVIPCTYTIPYSQGKLVEIVSAIREAIGNVKGGSAMKISIS